MLVRTITFATTRYILYTTEVLAYVGFNPPTVLVEQGKSFTILLVHDVCTHPQSNDHISILKSFFESALGANIREFNGGIDTEAHYV